MESIVIGRGAYARSNLNTPTVSSKTLLHRIGPASINLNTVEADNNLFDKNGGVHPYLKSLELVVSIRLIDNFRTLSIDLNRAKATG